MGAHHHLAPPDAETPDRWLSSYFDCCQEHATHHDQTSPYSIQLFSTYSVLYYYCTTTTIIVLSGTYSYCTYCSTASC